MALIICPECGKQVSDKAKACIHCGYPLDEVISPKESNGNVLVLNSWIDETVKWYLFIYQGFPYSYTNSLSLENLPIVVDIGGNADLQDKMLDDIIKLGGDIVRRNSDEVTQEKISEYMSLGVTNVRVDWVQVARECPNQRFNAWRMKIRKVIGMTQDEMDERKAGEMRAEQRRQQLREETRREIETKKYGETVQKSDYSSLLNPYAPQKKDASVIGRAVAGGVLAGPAGAIVGALSAVDKNNKNRK